MPVAKKNTAIAAAIQSGLNVRGTKAAPVKATKAATAKASTKKADTAAVKTTVRKPAAATAVKAPAAVKTVAPKASTVTKPASKPATKPVAKADDAKAKATPRKVWLYQKNSKTASSVKRVSDHLKDRAVKLARSRVQANKDQGAMLKQLATDMMDGKAFWAVPKKDKEVFTTAAMYLAVDFADGTTRIFAADNGDVLVTLTAKDVYNDFDYFQDA